ncbi:MAG: GEVED domain-containing protein [Bacteroidales bacterium]
MKRVSLLCLSLLMFGLASLAQPTAITFNDFEAGIPIGWTASSTTNIQAISNIVSRGTKSIRMKNNTTASVTLTSPIYTRNPFCNVRLEFDHIPILKNPEGSGQVEVSVNGGIWRPLTATSGSTPTYDNTYGGGIVGSVNWNGNFVRTSYWSGSNTDIPETQLDNSYWRHEIFYLNSILGEATSFQIRFKLSATTLANTFAGWYIDDFRLYQSSTAGNTVRVPQLNARISSPNMLNYPNSADIKVEIDVGFLQSAPPANADSIFVEYILGSSQTVGRSSLLLNSTSNNYVGYIPFTGYDTITKWRIVLNDSKYNRLTFPFEYERWNEFKSVREYVGSDPLQNTGLSSQELMMKTNSIKNLFQFRYRGSELRAKGMSAGKLDGLGYNLTQAASGFTMNGFNMYIANIPPNLALSTTDCYNGQLQQVYGFGSSLVVPPTGWQYLQFSDIFIWDGFSDIIIKVCWENVAGSSVGGTTKMESIVAPGASGSVPSAQTGQMYQSSGYQTACISPFNNGDGLIGFRPNFQFNFIKEGKLAYDVGIDSTLLSPSNLIVTANTPTNFKVKINNYGSASITNGIVVKYKIDNVATPTLAGTWTGTLPSNPAMGQYTSVDYQFPNSISFTPGYRHIKVWTDQIIGHIDWEPENDTAYFEIVSCNGPLSGIYAIGNVSGVSAEKTFRSFKEAFKTLQGCGVSGPVTFRVTALPADQYYTDTLSFPTNITGSSTANYIKFVSATNNQMVFLKPVKVANSNYNLSGAKYYKFENIGFYSADSCLISNECGPSNIVQFSNTTSNIEFKKCSFVTSPNGIRPTYHINIGAANNIIIDSCIFNGDADAQLYIKGSSPANLGNGVSITNSSFINNLGKAIHVEYSQNTIISKNKFINNRTINATSTNNVLVQSSKNFKITKNLFTLNNVSAIAISDALASTTVSTIANNKISVYNGNSGGTSTANVYGINIISGSNLLVAYNNVYAKDQGTGLVSYALSVGTTNANQILSSIRVKNNILISDGYGYAVYARTTNLTDLDFSNNIYYKFNTMVSAPSLVLWRYNSTNCTSIENWQTTIAGDAFSYDFNPLFTDWNILNTSNSFLCFKGANLLPEINDDYASLTRPASPCIGADQFAPPPSNVFVQEGRIDGGIETVGTDGNLHISACGLGGEYITITYSNISTNPIAANSLQFWYKIDNLAVTAAQKDTVHIAVAPNTIYTHTFRNPYNFGVTNADRTFKVTAFAVLAADIIRTNDTVVFNVLSRHQLAALAPKDTTINYGDSINLSVVSNDSIYWFLRNTDFDPILKSHNYQTSRLFSDTTFYFSRKSEIPSLKISEIQFSKAANSQGLTPNPPSYLNTNNLVEISNYGNGAINLKGIQFGYISGTRGATDTLNQNLLKSTIFGDHILPAGTSVVLQLSNGTSQDSSVYLNVGAGYFNANSKMGLFLKDTATNTYIDVCVVNKAYFDVNYHTIPTTVWSGIGRTTSIGIAGLIRNIYNAKDSIGWVPSSATKIMTIGTIDSTHIVSYDNGCFGFMSPYNVHVSGVPSVDPGVCRVRLVGINQPEECTLTNEQVELRVTNTGVQASNSTPLALQIYEGSTLIQTYFDTCNITIPPSDTITYIFSQRIDLSANTSNKNFRIVAFSNLSFDAIHLNDTSSMQITSLKTPYAPTSTDVLIPYASSTTLNATGIGNDMLIWYNSLYSLNELSRTSYTTPILYETDTFYVGAMIIAYDTIQLGQATTISTTYPSALNGNIKNVKEQYLFKASELSDLGFSEGNINSLMFDIASIASATNLLNYTIKIGTTDQEFLSTWIYDLNEVYSNTSLAIATSNLGWKNFQFTHPFYYDGTSNIVIEICFEREGTVAKLIKTRYSITPFNSSLYYTSGTVNACAWNGAAMAVNRTLRPNTKFYIDKFGCSSVRTPVVVEVESPPTCEVGLITFTNPSSTTVMSGIQTPIQVEIKNFGSEALLTTPIDWSINDVIQTQYIWTGNLAPNTSTVATIGNYNFTSGINIIKAWTSLACDPINTNDSISFEFSACIGNNTSITNFSIGGPGADFPTINSAVTALVNSGICGDVVFNINPINAIYNEQVSIPQIVGTENSNTITFRGNPVDSNLIVLHYNADSNADKYALKLDGAVNILFENFTIQNYDSTYSTLVEISNNSSNIQFKDMTIKSKPHSNLAFETAKLVSILGTNDLISFDNVNFEAGATSIYSSAGTDSNATNIKITNSFFNNFAFDGANLNDINNLYLNNNKFRQYTNANISNAITLRNIYGNIEILKNDIYLEGGTKPRTGIYLRRIFSSILNPLELINNSISLSGTYNNTAINYSGIDLDSVYYAKIYYNTVKVRASNYSSVSKALSVGTRCSDLKVLNNNLENAGKGYAYYVNSPADQITASNNNNYFTNGTIPIFWSGPKQTIALLQTANSQDALSQNVSNPFISDSLLGLTYPSDIVRKAEPLDDYTDDIRGRNRPISPRPTIGAYEYDFSNIDAGPTQIITPDQTVKYIENQPLNVELSIKNFGLYGVDTVKVTAVLKYNVDTTHVIQTVNQTFIQPLGSLESTNLIISNPLYPPLHFRNVNDSLYLFVFTQLTGDTIHINDTIYTKFQTIPSTNIQVVNTVGITERCQLYQTQIQMTIKSIGETSITSADSVWLNYEVTGRPELSARELLTFPLDDGSIFIQKNQQYIYTFNQTANLYPLGLVDTTWKLRTFSSCEKDNVKVNDTSAFTTITSRVSPPAPITHDTSIHYGTWAEPWASQINNLAIKWYSDSTLADPFYSPTNYNLSTKYKTTQLFVDSTYYLRVNLTGQYPCVSRFTPIKVTMRDRSLIDGACIGLEEQGITEPPQEGWVYMTSGDTIKVKVANYGTMPMQNFNLTYSIQKASPANSPIITVTELCTNTVQPNGNLIYRFDSLADFTGISNFKIRAWVDVASDATAINDTSGIWLVKPKNGNTIYPPSISGSPLSLDITRVQLGNMDNSSNNSGITYTNFTEIINPVVLFKGIYDSIYIQAKKPSGLIAENEIGGYVRVFIDWNRNGIFEASENVFSDTIASDLEAKGKIIVPASTITGNTRMRVILWQGRSKFPVFNGDESPTFGEVEDYKVLVRNTWPVNAELVKFTQPETFLTQQLNNINVVLRNAGTTALTSARINWLMNGQADVYNWNGLLDPGNRIELTLRSNEMIPTGQTNFVAWVDVDGDIYHENDTIRRNSYIPKTYFMPYECDFDEEGYDDFYAFNVNPLLPTNCWEFGNPDPSNTYIKGPFSAPNCWKTVLAGKHPANNESILYSPIFDIGIIKPDTMTFMMKRELGTGSYVQVEYLNDRGDWARLGAKGDGFGTSWYVNDSNRFEGSANWTKHTYSIQGVNYLGNKLQLRFVFRGGSTIKDGIAIDDFQIKRALRPADVGVVKVDPEPRLPNFGSTYYPKIKVRNYGSEAITQFTACYTAENMYIPVTENVTLTTPLQPGDTTEYTFNNGQYIFDYLPLRFKLTAFTRLSPTDLYSDNDSLSTYVYIGPLAKDVALKEILSPSDVVVANNDIEISIRLKNLGIQPIFNLPVYFKVTGQDLVSEEISFNPPLYNNEEYIYRFNSTYRSSYGAINLKTWTGLEGDYYHDNDTLFRRVNGASSTRDIEAKFVTIDDYNTDYIGVQLTFQNNSSVGIRDIAVGYYYNGDRTTMVQETYRLGNTLTAGSLGHHYFQATLPKANAPYYGICGFVHILDDNNVDNDTTCTLYVGRRDAKSDTIYIEQNSNLMSLVQLRARNIGTIGGPMTINAGYVLNGDWLNPVIQTFNWPYNEPNPDMINYLTFNQRIPRQMDRIYDIVAWVDYQHDANRSNDTTYIYKTTEMIGLDDEVENNEFTLDQNVPNPLEQSTSISFNLPSAGKTRFFVVNNLGKLIINENKFYSEGKHEISLNNLNLPQGIYYYVLEFEGRRLTKKMIVVR